MANTDPKIKYPSKIKPVLGYLGWAIIAAGAIFYAGMQFQTRLTIESAAKTQAAVHDALKAVATPAAVATVGK